MLQKSFQAVRVEKVQKKLYQHKQVQVDVLRLDETDTVISGNKWYKLKGYLKDAEAQGKETILTFGGAFSNHIVATAAAAKAAGKKAIGVIRGEAPPQLSHTLQDAQQYGMQLFFVSREAYRDKKIPPAIFEQYDSGQMYVVGEGGYGTKGREGASDILKECSSEAYTHIGAAVGTGTMLAGLAASALPFQKIVGISALKGNTELHHQVNALLPEPEKNFEVLHDFHFGGYAKRTPELLQFMNDWYHDTGIPSDFVYTGKLFFAVDQLIQNNFFAAGSRLLLVHSGGLQGNRSLPKGTLIF